VRKLAERSKTFADQVATLASGVTDAVEHGAVVVGDANAEASRIQDTADRVARMIRELHSGAVPGRIRKRPRRQEIGAVLKRASARPGVGSAPGRRA
jgi:hypothetical protein